MKTIDTTLVVDAEHRATIQLPSDVAPGAYRAVVVVEEPPVATGVVRSLADIPVIDIGPWPEGLSLRREDMYGDDGR